ncbi:8-oxo-dGTP pyrophosphatase MutT (NUDIX family) [Arthrobacter sp. CAN_A6]|uniref:NUDIX hydrolase n=1 Tax=Arthrobacter sp. CAN_A6 TaxID=2787721 RepID=UPI001A2FE3DE
MNAYDSLSVYASSLEGVSAPVTRANWHLSTRGLENARRAAVLMLFGALRPGPHPDPSALQPADLDVLLMERAGSLNNHPGQVSFPGGAVDPSDVDERAAALREAEEETGLDPLGVEVLGVLPEVGLPVSNFLVTPVLAWWARQTPVAVVSEAESTQVFRVPVGDLLNPSNRRTAVVRRRGSTMRSPAFVLPNATVWGFTAILLDSLFEGLQWTQPWDPSLEIPAPL